MKKTNKGFTLVELIIVIAVIGVLAAILIPVFANVIEKANRKSAYSDARNALSVYIAEKSTGDGAIVVTENSVFKVHKTSGDYYFKYVDNGIKEAPEGTTNYYTASDLPTGEHAGSQITQAECDKLPGSVTIYLYK